MQIELDLLMIVVVGFEMFKEWTTEVRSVKRWWIERWWTLKRSGKLNSTAFVF